LPDPILTAPSEEVLSSPGLGIGESFAATTGSTFAFNPNVMGDFLGGGSTVSLEGQFRASQHVFGYVVSGNVGAPDSILAFEVGTSTPPDDLFTTGTGRNTAGGSFVDTFDLAEPVSPTDAPTPSGPGYKYDGGTVVYTGSQQLTSAQPANSPPFTGSGDIWFASYSYTNTTEEGAIIFSGPGVAARRLKIFEGFSPEVRHRVFVNYSFFNDALGGLGDVSRWTLGFEKPFLDNLFSFEMRLPLAATLASDQNITSGARARDFEIGNGLLIGKAILLRRDQIVWSSGLGITVPFADDARLKRGNDDVVIVKNDAVNLIPFSALLLRTRDDGTVLQGGIQVDVAANGTPVYGDSQGGQGIPKIGTFNDATLLYLDASVSQRIYQNRSRRPHGLSLAYVTAELHYTETLQDADIVSGNGVTYTSLGNNFNVLNATLGLQTLIGQHLQIAPGMSIPLRDGLDEQFDYEAILQVNYLF
jgi:hypothetical protein